jgi:hypothetical protein
MPPIEDIDRRENENYSLIPRRPSSPAIDDERFVRGVSIIRRQESRNMEEVIQP